MDDSHIVTKPRRDDVNPYVVVYKRAPLAASAPQYAPISMEVKVLSWNVSGLRFSAMMLEGLFDTIAEAAPTVMLLQEASPTPNDALCNRLHMLYDFHAASSDVPHTCMIGVRRPGVLRDMQYSRCLSTRDGRGILVATVEWAWRSIRVATTHLESGAVASGLRRNQFEEVLREDALILAGGFNIRDK